MHLSYPVERISVSMKALRIFTLTLFILTALIFGWFYFDTQIHTDSTYPQIQITDDLLEISIHDGEDVLLQGITAHDAKDGDLTSKVIVESISQFSEANTCTVAYAVADSDRHVAKSTRKIRYVDYTSPHFVLAQPMIFSVGKSIDVSSIVGATDCIDGDISSRVIISATDYQANSTGVFSLSLQATNSKGDIAYLDLKIFVEEQAVRAPVIELTDYLIYVQQGQQLDFSDYVASITPTYNAIDQGSFLISETYDPQTPGVYDIHYYIMDTVGNEAHTVLTVVVEE